MHSARSSTDSTRVSLMRVAEDAVQSLSHQMSRLKAEYDHNCSVLRNILDRTTRPLEVQVYESLHRKHWAEIEISWKQKVLENLKTPSKERADLTPALAEFTQGYRSQFDAAAERLAEIPQADLKILRDYTDPPPHFERPVMATLTVLGEKYTNWEESSLFLRNTYFFGFFVDHARKLPLDLLSPTLLAELSEYLFDPDFDAKELSRVSVPCGAMSSWVASVYNYLKAKQIRLAVTASPQAGPLLEEALMKELSVEVDKLSSQLRFEDQEMAGIHYKLGQYRAEFEQQLIQLKHKYDRSMDALQESFFDAHQKFVLASQKPSVDRAVTPVKGGSP